MSYTLRLAVAGDMAEIMRLERAGFAAAIQETEHTFAERLRAAPEGCWVLAGEAGRLYGYLCAEFWPLQTGVDPARFARDHAAAETHDANGEEVYISSMVVDPATRGTGWGRRLFSDALAAMFARQPRLRSAILIVNPEWQAARRIYQAEGFREIGEIAGYFAAGDGARLPAIVMRRPQT
ncbi:GNAT family N-acetyltransferase [Pseudoduganella sp.]|uniref:GNAT family N-acetyltransferase n=1 Tax=Pseudoduganella sp. TaxID=1880898 RepID=UPI0035B34409